MNEFDARVRRLMADLSTEDTIRTAPPPSVWDAIARDIAEDGDRTSEEVRAPGIDSPPVSLGAHRRRRRARRWTLAAAAAFVVVVGAAVIVDQRRAGEPDVIAATTVSSDGLDAPPGLATQAVIEESDGVRRLTLDASAVEVGDDEFLELWLINDDITDMVSLGMVRRGESYEIPADVELDEFPIIDVSIEPDDGVPTHSGRSVLRGRLEA